MMNEVYRKYGEVSELAQLLESEIGTLLIRILCIDPNSIVDKPELAWTLLDDAHRPALSLFIRQQKRPHPEEQITQALNDALKAQHRLNHNFFRMYHDSNSTDMLEALEAMFVILWKGYQSALLLSGVDVNELINA